VIPVRFRGEDGAYVHSMYLDDEGPIAGGRELWGFPKKLARPKIEVESDVLVGTLHYGSVLCVSATMGYKHRYVDHDTVLKSMKAPNFMLKIIPHVDGSARVCELVRLACFRMHWPTSQSFRCARSFRRYISGPTSRLGSAPWRSIILRSEPDISGRCAAIEPWRAIARPGISRLFHLRSGTAS